MPARSGLDLAVRVRVCQSETRGANILLYYGTVLPRLDSGSFDRQTPRMLQSLSRNAVRSDEPASERPSSRLLPASGIGCRCSVAEMAQ